MKVIKQLFVAILLFAATVGAQAASPKKEMVTRTYTASIHCNACKARIMNSLPFKRGVKYVDVDIAKREITVKYDSEKSSDKAIVEALKSVKIEARLK